jgi:anti-sigma B factor antagonist
VQTSPEEFVQDPRAGLDVDVTHDGDTLRMQVAGELDMATALRLLDALQTTAMSDGTGSHATQGIVVDLTQLTFCDVRGLAALVQTHQTFRESGRTVSIRGASSQIRRMLTITGEQGILDPDSHLCPRSAVRPVGPQ